MNNYYFEVLTNVNIFIYNSSLGKLVPGEIFSKTYIIKIGKYKIL